ncbi:hypothetical protein FBQ97_09480 [Acidobacteria bacterium ACD]|nr:hypothetical protein [Acidobacteria bacterium ACD]
MTIRPSRQGPASIHVVSVLSLCLLVPVGGPAAAETVIARRPSDAPATPTAEQILRDNGFPDFWCYPTHCVVSVDDAVLSERLQGLDRPDMLELEPLPDARRVFFARGTWDAETRAIDSAVPGLDEVPSSSPTSLFVVVFKAFSETGWIAELRGLGLVPLEPMPQMGYKVWGPRAVVASLPGGRRHVRTVYEVPAGLKRFRVDTLPSGDAGGPAVTHVHVVDAAASDVVNLLASLSPRPPAKALRTGTVTAWSVLLTPPQAIDLSRRGDVVAVARETLPVEPSDERTNRIIGGTFGTPGTSWPASVGTNASPYYWEGFMASLASIGIDPSNQSIGFLDTGVDEALVRAGPTPNCPPHLLQGGDCRLIFTTDASEDFDSGVLDMRADDWLNHGTTVTAVAAGRTTDSRDSRGWAFEHGVAPGVNVAMSAIFRSTSTCGEGSTVGRNAFLETQLSLSDFPLLLRYSLVEMTAEGNLPGRSAAPDPPIRIFNHSWNRISEYTYDPKDYDLTAQLIDQTSRNLAAATLVYRPLGGGPETWTGASGQPALHVLSAGNREHALGELDMPLWVENAEVFSPGTAKNGITVGATRTDDPRTCNGLPSYDPDCWGAENLMGSNPRVVTGFSRVGYPNFRLKPDLVAPGSRVYGRLTERGPCETENDPCRVRYGTSSVCDLEEPNPGEKIWMRGTSFATPAVSGAAALVRDWLRAAFSRSTPSPALMRSVLVAGARNLVPWREAWGSCCEDPSNCWPCADMRPAPDQYQGWGGLSLDRLFGDTSRYYLYDQGTTFTAPGQTFTKTLTITDPTKPITVVLAWTDRASTPTVDSTQYNLVNDLDLMVTTQWAEGEVRFLRRWRGNHYYCDRDAVQSGRTGYSLDNGNSPCTLTFDRKNNLEKIDIHPSRIPPNNLGVKIVVTAAAITADGVDVFGSTPRQDFAIAVENAHE